MIRPVANSVSPPFEGEGKVCARYNDVVIAHRIPQRWHRFPDIFTTSICG